jgi:hypothetical protein
MTIALYATIWLALALLVAGALTRSAAAYGTGAALAIIHALIALGLTYEWNHERAVSETARQAAAVYGFAWRGSIYVSYAFLIVWAIDALASQRLTRSWIGRAFFLIVIFNGAVVFASPIGRVLGVAVVACLVWAWRPRAKPTGA